jgi:NADH-quinone oxidoreductase subunit H
MAFLSDPINVIADWLRSFDRLGIKRGMDHSNPGLAGGPCSGDGVLLVDILLVWVERKVVARLQDRLGPNRLGPFGLIQPIADVIKLLIKEDITPQGADKFIFNLAPIMALATVSAAVGCHPIRPGDLWHRPGRRSAVYCSSRSLGSIRGYYGGLVFQ